MKIITPTRLAFWIAAPWFLSATVYAATPALTIQTGDLFPISPVGPVTLGWQFTVKTPITVTSLGVLDAGWDGLNEVHPVSIWDATTGAILASANVGPGSALDADFSYVAVSNIVLNPGSYIIGAFYLHFSPDYVFTGVEAVTTDPSITYEEGLFEFYDELRLPGGHASDIGIFGPNFKIISESPAAIVSQPKPLLVYLGDEAVFEVGSIGAAPLEYQWRHDGEPLPGATNAILTLTNVTLEDAGNYDVLVSNQFGSPVVSQTARLEVSFLKVAQFTGLILLGEPGDQFRIESTTNIALPYWLPLTNTTLESTSATWIDLESRFQKQRLYRAVRLQ
jgi:Immunoglobulin domain